jgi:hypothetical protein
MVRIPPMVIFLHHGEVPIYDILISRPSSNSANLPFAKSSMELLVISLTLLSSC